MERPAEIIVRLDTIAQLVRPRPRSVFLKRRLREEAEQFIVQQARLLPRNAGAKLIVHLPEREAARSDEVTEAVHQHFNLRRVEAEEGRDRTRRFGWRSLFIGMMFLATMMLLVQVIDRYLPAGNLTSVAREGLIILAWVALWRPGELLLYEWYPFNRDARLFGKLEHAEVQFRVETERVTT